MISELPLPLFLLLAAITLGAAYLDVLPEGMTGAVALLMPSAAEGTAATFMKGGGFLDFYIAALITGSILGMSRTILIRAAARYFPAIAGGLVAAFGLAGLAGALTGYGAKRAILYVAIPIMGGGMGAGAVPLSEVFGETLQEDPGQVLSIMVPALALGNALSIVMAGLLDKLGRLKLRRKRAHIPEPNSSTGNAITRAARSCPIRRGLSRATRSG